ncbi:MAG: hypothetical protein ACI9U2_001516 [Bradymonadia bacterium]|jgi:hypothetical protein
MKVEWALVLGLTGCLRQSDEAKLQSVDMGASDTTDLLADADVDLPPGDLRCEFAVNPRQTKVVFAPGGEAPDLPSGGAPLLIWSPERTTFMALAVDQRSPKPSPKWIELGLGDRTLINNVVGVVSPMCLSDPCAMGDSCRIQGVVRAESTDDYLVVFGKYGTNSRAQVQAVPSSLEPIDCDVPRCEVSPLAESFDGGNPERISNPLPHADGSLSIAWQPEGDAGSYLARCAGDQRQFDTGSGRHLGFTEITQRQALAAHDPHLLIAGYDNSGGDLVQVLTLTETEPVAVTTVGHIDEQLEGFVPDALEISLALDDRLWVLAGRWDKSEGRPVPAFQLMQSDAIGPDSALGDDEWHIRMAKTNDIHDAQMLMTGDGPALAWFDATQEKLIFSWLDLDGKLRGIGPEFRVDAECLPERVEMAWNGLSGIDARFGMLWGCGSAALWYQEVRCYAD